MLLFLTGCAASPIETSEPTLPTPMTEATQPDPTETTVPATTPFRGPAVSLSKTGIISVYLFIFSFTAAPRFLPYRHRATT